MPPCVRKLKDIPKYYLMKLFIFAETKWALGRIYRDFTKFLDYEVRYLDWATYVYQDFLTNYEWCDKCLTNLCAYPVLKTSFPCFDLKKCIFVSHGFIEHREATYDENLTYGMTSDSLRSLFPPNITPFLMPNGVDPDNFNYIPRNGSITTIGWCGAFLVVWKQVNWAEHITKSLNIPLKICFGMSYDEVREWYNTIDLLLITSTPEPHIESGPLPAFEAIVSGVPVLGTPVGNFRHIPGPKFTTVEEGTELVRYYRENPTKLVELAKEQYDYVINNYTYKTLSKFWKDALEFS
jgi:glycosyltransferase involved in cell wall biosynthesis